MTHLTTEELHAGLETIRRSPNDDGRLEMIVRRPAVGEREVLAEGRLEPAFGLVGDGWSARGGFRQRGETPDADTQITIINARLAALVAQDQGRWALAGDQLYLDLDLSGANLPPGTRLALGAAIVEVTAQPHTGCRKFVDRFGLDAMKFVNSPLGHELNLRGIYARVAHPGTIRVGDRARKLPDAARSG